MMPPSGARGRAQGGPGRLILLCGLVAGGALAAFLIGATLGGAGESGVPAFEHLQRQMRRDEVPQKYASISFAFFLNLPAIPIRTMADLVAVDEMERQAVSLTGYIARVLPVPIKLAGHRATDYNFQLHLRPASTGRCLIEDSPRDIVTVVSPAFQPPRTGWELDQLRLLCERQDRVRISGWLLYDHLSRQGVGRWRATAWAIHPVTRIEVWNAREQTWENLS